MRYSGTLFDKVKFGIGGAFKLKQRRGEEMYGAQLSFTHSSGLGVTVVSPSRRPCSATHLGSVGTRHRQDPACVIQGHFQRKFNELGNSTIVVEYDQKDNMEASGDTAVGIGVTLHQAIDAAAMEVWFKYSNFELDRDGTDTDDVDVFTIGSRMRF